MTTASAPVHPLSARTWGSTARLLVALGLAAWTGASVPAQAAGLWVWQDDSGRKVFSDLPPPASVPNSRIAQQPRNGPLSLPDAPAQPATTAPETPRTANAAAKTAAPGPSSDPVPAARQAEDKRKADDAQRATERRNAEIRADNCKRAQASRATLQGGGRLATVDENGQRVLMDEAMRNAEQARLDQIIADNCR